MAKILKYNLCTKVNRGTNEEPQMEEILSPVELSWSESNEELAKREAYNGEYEIVDDGQPDPVETPTWQDKIEAQVTYTAMMSGTLLEEV